MSEGFKPGVDAARKALGASIPIVHNVHPGGAKGVRLSLQEVANRIKKGRNDPRVRAWAVRAIKAAGGPQDTFSQAQAILSALKQATVYVQDPVNTEFIQAAHETLCLDDKGLCFRGGDCDDLVVAYGSATLSVGIPTKIIGEKFNNEPVASHVLAAIYDVANKTWLRVDPSTDKPVGQYVIGTGEEWIDPMSDGKTGVSGDASGDFVGVGRAVAGPQAQGLAATNVAPTPGFLPTLVLFAIPPLAIAAVNPDAAKTLAVTEVGGLAGYQLGGILGSFLAGGDAGSAGGWFIGSMAGMIMGGVTAHRMYKGRRNPITITKSAPNGFIVLSSHGSEAAAVKAANRRPESNITIVHQPETARTKARWFVGRAVTGGRP